MTEPMRKRSKIGRYARNEQGKIIKVADIYPFDDHKIDNNEIDKEVFQIAKQLKARGYEAYLVGGAVRDLLLGSKPKDFDIVTDAIPSEIRSFIKNSRVIGKRFRLVHIFYPGGKIIEVITFRSLDSGAHNPLYGTIEEDVQRRDFTVNALYYNLNNEQILDFVGAMADFRKRQMRNIIALPQIFKEDPVRIIRCIKYAVKTGFKIPKKIVLQIRRDSKMLNDCSKSRLAEELSKILCSEHCARIMEELQQHNIWGILLPCLNFKNFPGAYKVDFFENLLTWQKRLQVHNQAQEEFEELQKNALQERKRRHRRKKGEEEAKDKDKDDWPQVAGHLGKNLLGIGISYLFSAYFTYSGWWVKLLEMDGEERSLEAYRHLKECLNDLNIPNIEVSAACEHLFECEGLPFLPRLILKKYGSLGGRGSRGSRNGRRDAGDGRRRRRQSPASSEEGSEKAAASAISRGTSGDTPRDTSRATPRVAPTPDKGKAEGRIRQSI
ncbi:hypothetical protein P0082_01910 [Candidatus Haliotispira prima]|uniref:Polynucleotide adenylyltransferase n=1 Tax=Candidatus Haliotispira prima TaxID=3034016 RepID=A0ABY8MJ61_9SPIO|nr:hypothetical protein P0082_01910 [Candidatus Haliotispira prima]